METTEKIIESYVRYVRRWATIPDVRCEGQYEIDLLAIDPITHEKYHIESSISASKGFSRLTAKAFDPGEPNVHPATARRTVAYFRDKKFVGEGIASRLREYGFKEYKKIVVTWGWTEDAKREADTAGIDLWDFRDVVGQIAAAVRDQTGYFGDDTLRTIGLYVKAGQEVDRRGGAASTTAAGSTSTARR
jgi:hypothetical protein